MKNPVLSAFTKTTKFPAGMFSLDRMLSVTSKWNETCSCVAVSGWMWAPAKFTKGPSMSFKIERVPRSENEVVLNLCGRIQSSQVDTIRDSIAKETANIVLDLTQITLADRPAAIFLAKCEIDGIEIRNAPAFLAEWIARERRKISTGIP